MYTRLYSVDGYEKRPINVQVFLMHVCLLFLLSKLGIHESTHSVRKVHLIALKTSSAYRFPFDQAALLSVDRCWWIFKTKSTN